MTFPISTIKEFGKCGIPRCPKNDDGTPFEAIIDFSREKAEQILRLEPVTIYACEQTKTREIRIADNNCVTEEWGSYATHDESDSTRTQYYASVPVVIGPDKNCFSICPGRMDWRRGDDPQLGYGHPRWVDYFTEKQHATGYYDARPDTVPHVGEYSESNYIYDTGEPWFYGGFFIFGFCQDDSGRVKLMLWGATEDFMFYVGDVSDPQKIFGNTAIPDGAELTSFGASADFFGVPVTLISTGKFGEATETRIICCDRNEIVDENDVVTGCVHPEQQGTLVITTDLEFLGFSLGEGICPSLEPDPPSPPSMGGNESAPLSPPVDDPPNFEPGGGTFGGGGAGTDW